MHGLVIHAVAGEKIAEVVSYSIDKASGVWSSFDPTLTEDQARALGAAAVLGTVFTMSSRKRG